MSDPGLTNRLRQRSRRAGLAVGLTMALTIAVCIGAFAWIYAKADPLFADFVGAEATATRSVGRTPTVEATTAGSRNPANPAPTATTMPTAVPPTPTEGPTATSDAFTATHLTNPNSRVNFRPEPSLDTDPIAVLEPSTPVQALGPEEVDGDGNRWLKFRTEDGLEGWLREDAFVAI
jgi:Bacterial SH3 domain